MLNKIKIAACIIALQSNVNAMSFEDSPAFNQSSTHFRKTHEILTALPSVEILIARGTYSFNGWYMATLEEYFHNVVTPILQNQIEYNINFDDMETASTILENILKDRNKLMIDAFKKAFDVATKMKTDYALSEEMTEESPHIGCLMSLSHYKPKELSEPAHSHDHSYTVVEAIAVNDAISTTSTL